MDDFNIISEQDKKDLSYGACVAGSALTGMAVGRFIGLQGLLAGAAAGLAFGLLACRHLQEPIKKKLFSDTGRLTDQELAQAPRAVRLETGVQSKADAMYLLAAARTSHRAGIERGSARSSNSHGSARASAQLLLQGRT